MENELYHYGVLGMKWGIRRFQNKDGSLTDIGKKRYRHGKVVIKKGEEVQRISKTDSEATTGRTYISFKKLDNLKYIAEAGRDGLYWTANYDPKNPNNPKYTNEGYKVKLKVTKDIIAPSFDESIDAFLKTVKDIPLKQLTNDLYGDYKSQKTPNDRKEYKKNTKEFVNNMKHLSIYESRQNAYFAYSKKIINSEKQQKAFFDELKSRGYNAVVDHNDARPGKDGTSYFEAPIIVFEKSNNLRQISATPITWRDREKAESEIFD